MSSSATQGTHIYVKLHAGCGGLGEAHLDNWCDLYHAQKRVLPSDPAGNVPGDSTPASGVGAALPGRVSNLACCQELGGAGARVFLLCEAAAFYASIMRTQKHAQSCKSTLGRKANMG